MSDLIAHSDVESQERPEHLLNAYLFDFYTHGQVSTLSAANGIRRGDVWYLLQSFELILKAIKSSLEDLLLQLSEARAARAAMPSAVGSNVRVSESWEDEDDGDLEEKAAEVNADRPVEGIPATTDSVDVEDEDDEEEDIGRAFARPPGTTNEDWKVYKTVETISKEFSAAFRKMWA
ncbi:hypothetical protein V5O48_015688 [Marasmius crinis-equi]|uniref:Uncharacterized protein n=1 Tax=Marasmius crinis-equi TaxID=585013 RepID=A0ABR3ETW5_9AGAR